MTFLVTLAVALLAQQNAPAPPPVSPSKPLGTFDAPNADQPPSLHSVGVRGTIDTGGYAASAEVKTQTELYEQLTRLQVAALRSRWAPPDPCAGSNSLRRPAIASLSRADFPSAATALEARLHASDEPATRQLLGLAYEGTGQLEAAAEQFRLAAAAQLDEAGLVAQGVALLLEGDVDRAEAIFRRALKQGRGATALAPLGLGAALFQHGQVAEALGLFLDAAAAQHSESAPFGFIAIAVRSAEPATLTHSINMLTSLTQRQSKDGSANYALACALIAAAGGAPDGPQSAMIEAQLKEAIMLDPRLADAHFRLAGIYAAREDLSQAIAEYRTALDCDPRLVEAHYRLSQLYARAGQPESAADHLKLHQQLRARQKDEIESGKIPIRFAETTAAACPPAR